MKRQLIIAAIHITTWVMDKSQECLIWLGVEYCKTVKESL